MHGPNRHRHFDNANDDLEVAHCNDAACTSAALTTVDGSGGVVEYNALTIGQGGLPVISYYDITNGDLKVAHCDNTACTRP